MLLSPLTFVQLFDTRPAGDVLPEALRTGAPQAQYPDGPWLFRANVLFVGAIPNLDAAALGESFAAELARLSGARLGAATRPVVDGAHAPTAPMAVPDGRGGTRNVESLWVTVSGELLAVAPFATELVQRALAVALAAAVRGWDPVDAAYRDQTAFVNSLALGRFRAPDACTGGADLRSVVARGCVRIAPVEARAELGTVPTPAIPPVPPVAPPAPPAPPALPVAAPVPGYPRTVRTAARFWLRARPTFAHEGPEFPAGTTLTVLGPAVGSQGSLALYPVEVTLSPAQRGYAALSAADLAGTVAVAPAPPPAPIVPVTPVRVPGPAAPVPVTPVRVPGPAAPVPVTPVALPGQPAPVPVTPVAWSESRPLAPGSVVSPAAASSSWWKWALGLSGFAALAVGAVVVVTTPPTPPARTR